VILPMLLMLQTTPSAPPPPSEDEIVVIARKLQMIEVDLKVGKREGRMTLRSCRISRPSGRAEADAVPCEVAQQCMADGAASRKQLIACVEERSQVRLDALVASWRAAS
jgi:hypothetical protein